MRYGRPFYFLIVLSFFVSVFLFSISSRVTISSSIFDLVLLLSLVLAFFRKPDFSRLFLRSCLLFLMGYFIYFYFYIQGFYVNFPVVFEFLRSSRHFVYLFLFYVLFLFVKDQEPLDFPYSHHQYLWKGLVFCYLAFYLFDVFILGNYRPTFIAENNYEIVSLILLSIFVFSGYFYSFLVFFVSVLSLSKSGILVYFFTFFMQSNLFKRYLIFLAPLGAFFLLIVFNVLILLRGAEDISEIDRFRFLVSFWEVFSRDGIRGFIFGFGIAAELPFYVCLEFDFYSVMNVRPEYCNSIIYHSFLMRILYDSGFLGLFLFLGVWYWLLIRAFGLYTGFVIVVILLISSLSVSAFSNSIVIWPLFYALYYRLKSFNLR